MFVSVYLVLSFLLTVLRFSSSLFVLKVRMSHCHLYLLKATWLDLTYVIWWHQPGSCNQRTSNSNSLQSTTQSSRTVGRPRASVPDARVCNISNQRSDTAFHLDTRMYTIPDRLTPSVVTSWPIISSKSSKSQPTSSTFILAPQIRVFGEHCTCLWIIFTYLHTYC